MLELNTIQADDAAGLMMSVLQVLNGLKYTKKKNKEETLKCFSVQAFQEMGHHEANNIALTHTALFCYERLRPR